MSRGWESKDVESRQEEALARREVQKDTRTPEEIERDQKRQSILLSRQRVLNDLERATHPRYKKQLQESLKFLNQQLDDID